VTVDKQEQKRQYMREYAKKRRASDVEFLEKCRENGRRSRLKRRDVALQECAQWKSLNKDKVSEYNKKYNLKNRSVLNEKACERSKQRRKEDPVFVLIRRERVRVYDALKGVRKSAKTETLLGCSYQFFREYIESKFCDGMSWENMGLWHIDHIKPICSFHLSDPDQQKIAFNYKNQQPLWSQDNLKKGARYA
jgi:hypothetical protein